MGAASFAVAACSSEPSPAEPSTPGEARFSYFLADGDDARFAPPAEPGSFINPILPGFYPDPSVTRVGEDYYLVTSTFGFYPGLPVFHSTDLVNWTQIGNAVDRPDLMDFDGISLSFGLFAPAIEHHDGVFYIANTCVLCGGNFILTATDPAGPWSDPIWLPDVGGVDPSLFFKDDGTIWIVNHENPPGGSTYDGHKAIWLRQLDPETFRQVGDAILVIDGGIRIEDEPGYVEGPHVYFKDGWYYVSAAEGGTGTLHSQVIVRSREITGPYEAWDQNPILTQRDLPVDRPDIVTSTGHADFIQDSAGNWWALFLGVRPYAGDFTYNTGRETFLLPMTWNEGDWPVILPPQTPVPTRVARPAFPGVAELTPQADLNAPWRDDFDADELDPSWLFIRAPRERWWRLEDGALTLTARPIGIGAGAQPSFIGQRQRHAHAVYETELTFTPESAGDEAGLAILQNDHFGYQLGLIGQEDGRFAVRLSVRAGADDPAHGRMLEVVEAPDSPGGVYRLRITARGGAYDFAVAPTGGDWIMVGADLDGTLLSTQTAGGFVGAIVGAYAYDAP